MNMFKGVGVALVTPFQSNGQVDFTALQRLVEHQINNGTDYLVIQGTTGESATLSSDWGAVALWVRTPSPAMLSAGGVISFR